MPLGDGQAVNFLNGDLDRFAGGWRLEEGGLPGWCDEAKGLDAYLALPLPPPVGRRLQRMSRVKLDGTHHHCQGSHDRGALVRLH